MNVFLGSNEINDCVATLIVNGEEVFRFREGSADDQLVCDFDVRDKNGRILAQISKNNIMHVASGFVVEHQVKAFSIKDQHGEIIAHVEKIEKDSIKIQGTFCVNGHEVVINSNTLISGGLTMVDNVVDGFKKAIVIEPYSFALFQDKA